MRVYLAGPMSGIPQFNFPLFMTVAKQLRDVGFEVINPAEEDYKHGIGHIAEASVDGNPAGIPDTWGTVLARDVKMIADGGLDGIVLLPGWEKSRGARLEAFVGLLQRNFQFYEYLNGFMGGVATLPLHSEAVLDKIYDAMVAS